MNLDQHNLHTFLIERLHQYTPKQLRISNLRKSSILIPLIPWGKSYYILMTARSAKLNHHAGEMSFPGGQFEVEKDESLEDTALRETKEEIGISPPDFEILGTLDDLPTLTGYCIRPFIGFYKGSFPISFNLNFHEVSYLVKIPIEFLLNLNKFNEKEHRIKNHGSVSLLYFDFPDPKHKRDFHVWGASAHILANFLNTFYDKKVTSEHYHRPAIEEISHFFSNST